MIFDYEKVQKAMLAGCGCDKCLTLQQINRAKGEKRKRLEEHMERLNRAIAEMLNVPETHNVIFTKNILSEMRDQLLKEILENEQ